MKKDTRETMQEGRKPREWKDFKWDPSQYPFGRKDSKDERRVIDKQQREPPESSRIRKLHSRTVP